ncbi:MAG TPA: hypothetical protein VKQ29_01130 [Aliidongia sp.]|nr:hypothetical protein [Aliidongia sp.]
MTKFLRLLVLFLPVAVVAAGCDDKKGPAEKAGESIDNTVQKAKDAIDPPGPVEKAGRAVDKAVGN